MTTINLIFDSLSFDFSSWQTEFLQQNANIRIYDANKGNLPEVADFLLLWHPKTRDWSTQLGLKAAFALGAGLDHLTDLTLADDVPLLRLHDAGMKTAMCEYAQYAALRYQRHFDAYEQTQRQASWKPLDYRTRDSFTTGVLGLGELGQAVANHLSDNGYKVIACSRSRKTLKGISCYTIKPELDEFLQKTDLLINLLPKNHHTLNMINQAALAELPPQAAVVSMSRGGIINEEALLQAVDQNHIQWALLDVFDNEPLLAKHPFWQHPKIKVTPHISAQTLVKPGVKELLVRFSEFI